MSNYGIRKTRFYSIFYWLNLILVIILKYTKEKCKKGEENKMLNDEICKLRDKLNESIENGQDYSIIYKISVELDELIAKFYREKLKVI